MKIFIQKIFFQLSTAYATLCLVPKAFAADFVDYNAYNRALNNNLGNQNLGGIVSKLLPILLSLAGIILFGMLVGGGFTMLAGAADKESQEKGKKMITSSLTGFAIIFLAFWIAQILQVIFKIDIVG